jgi:hypothetical protein
MPDTYWLVSSSSTDIPVDYTVGGAARPTPRRGGTVTLEAVFVPDDGAVDFTALNTGRGVVIGQDARYDALMAYGEFAASAEIITGVDGQAYLHEELPDRAGVDTQFVLVTPPDSIRIAPFYAAVTAATDATTDASARRRIDLELAYLGAASEWVSRANARDDLVA